MEIGIQNIIEWLLMIIAIGVAIYYGRKSNTLVDKRKIIIKEINFITQNKEYEKIPEQIKPHFEAIVEASGIAAADISSYLKRGA